MVVQEYLAQSQLVGLALLVAAAGVVVLARRDRTPVAPVLAFFGIASLLAVVFGRLGALVLGGVQLELLRGNLAMVVDPLAPAGYSSFGAMFGAGLAALALRGIETRDVRNRIFDAAVPAGMAALAITRIGCLFEGCDYGAATDAPWSIAYPMGHLVWQEHLARGVVAASAPVSASIHPFPLYIAVPTLFLVTLLARRKLRYPGARAAAILLFYFVMRFVCEFFREPDNAMSLGWLNANQLAALVAFVAISWWAVSDVVGSTGVQDTSRGCRADDRSP